MNAATRSPSWPSVIVGGLTGGAVNWITGGEWLGIGVLVVVVVLWRLVVPRAA